MLEKTTGCLEQGSLRRLLPGSKSSLKSRRTLHCGFWSHGGGELELSPIWAALERSTETIEQPSDPRPMKSPLNGNGGIVLDFLYPIGTVNFIRQLSGWNGDRQDRSRGSASFGKISQRLFTSSAGESSIQNSDSNTAITQQSAPADSVDHAENVSQILVNSIRDVIERGPRNEQEEVWRKYRLLNPKEQKELHCLIIPYLSLSSRILDSERATTLFERGGNEKEQPAVYKAVIKSFLRLGNLPRATELHEIAARHFQDEAGSAELLAYLIEHNLWSQVIAAWRSCQDLPRLPDFTNSIQETLKGVPNLATQALLLADHVRGCIGTWSNVGDHKLIKLSKELIALAFRVVLVHLEPLGISNWNSILQSLEKLDLDTPELYEAIINRLISKKETKHAVQCYRRARQRQNLVLTRRTLRDVLAVCTKYHSVQGMQQVLDDWFRFYGSPSQNAYKLCIREFASQGDSVTVYALFEQYASRFSEGGIFKSADELAPLLHVHAVRGELDQAIEVFSCLFTRYKVQPTLLCWNILISAYAKVYDIDGAFNCFERLLETKDVKPDHYTFGTIMGVCVTRGDLESVIELDQLADSLGIEKSAAMVDCLVLAHIQDDLPQEAEDICQRALHIDLKGSRTRMWNYLIMAWAMRRDLKNAHRILREMTEANIDFDKYTYSALMQALAMAKQPDRAYSILKDVMKEAEVPATNFHYAVVMGGFLANNEVHKVFQVKRRMEKRGIKESSSTRLLELKAQAIQDERSAGGNKAGQKLPTTQRLFQNILATMSRKEISNTARKGLGRTPLDVGYQSMFYSYMVFILGQQDDFQTVKQLYTEFIESLPTNRQDFRPIDILSALMATKLREGDYKTVSECWHFAFSQAQKLGKPLRSVHDSMEIQILPIHQLSLSRALTFQITSLLRQGKIDELEGTMEDFLKKGFVADNKNWNYYIQLLARSHRFKKAFYLCEIHLMPGWTGWAQLRWGKPERNRLSLDLRKASRNPRYLRPKLHTMLELSRAYLDLQAAASESTAFQVLLDVLQKEFPKTLHAIKTMPRVDDELERKYLTTQ
ncbi:hypothetical protein F5884DRAFT_707782 [Xylogone sp. PMI_703]|nr:hypothetical protein F5884DRAFT_707782 [Xylogone sp. PMI_703]